MALQGGEEDRLLPQRCNMCWKEANGPCYRTACDHLLCESCAFSHFGHSQACPRCGQSLQEYDVFSITLGLPPSHHSKMVYQEAFKQPHHSLISQSMVESAELLTRSLKFHLSQLNLEAVRLAESDAGREDAVAKLRHEIGRVTMQSRNDIAAADQKQRETDHKLRLLESEFADLQVSYKEKSRKCQAWEKAYQNLRSQSGRGRNGGFTPPESPRAGAMRGPSGSFLDASGQGASMHQQQQPSPRNSAGSGGGGGGGMQRPGDRIHTTSPHAGGSGAGVYAERSGGGSGSGSGGGGGTRSSWPMRRPSTSRGGGGAGTGQISPMLRPRQAQHGFSSHAVTPSPTFAAQNQPHGTIGRYGAKRPETPLEIRDYYPSRNLSPSTRLGVGSGGNSGGGSGGGGVRSGRFFAGPKPGLF